MSRTSLPAFAGDARAVGALSAAKAVWWAANGLAARRMVRPEDGEQASRFTPKSPPPDPRALRRSWLEAFVKDAQDIAAGLYPPSERLPSSVSGPVLRSVDFLRDAAVVDARRRRGEATEARAEKGSEVFPVYYRQNFHFQSGGWLTSESARRYEAQVEALFSGAAGPMRRRALSLLARHWRERDQRGLRILDLACGSGSFLVDLCAAFPRAATMGLDLSLPYLEEAGRRAPAARVQGAAERLPFKDESLDAVTCVYLFHELPPAIRSRVAAEIARVLKPGGVFVLADSVQSRDAPEIERLLEAFPAFFHEPYYASYQETDLPALFQSAGLRALSSDRAFLTKALAFEKLNF
jgi:ubiquinone/menaquinone biosynthesis C-methylase UbiE